MSQKNTKTSISKKEEKKHNRIDVYGGHHTAKAEFYGNGNKARIKIIDQTSLDRLLMHDSISLQNYKILDKVYTDYCKSGFFGVKASSYTPRVKSTHDQSNDNYFILRKKVMDCFSHVKGSGDELMYKIFKKIIHDENITKREIDWIEKENNFDDLCNHVEKFYNLWGNS